MTPETCVTCSDEAVVALVVGLDGLVAEVEVGGRVERVALDLVPYAAVGERLLCHVGIALARTDAQSGGGSAGAGSSGPAQEEAAASDAGESHASHVPRATLAVPDRRGQHGGAAPEGRMPRATSGGGGGRPRRPGADAGEGRAK